MTDFAVFVDMYSDFLHRINGLPTTWKDKYGSFPSTLAPSADAPVGERNTNPIYDTMVQWALYAAASQGEYRDALTRFGTAQTPIRVLKRAEQEREKWILSQQRKQQAVQQATPHSASRNATVNAKLLAYNNKSSLTMTLPKPEASPASRPRSLNTGVAPASPVFSSTSPGDQLVSALLDGDVQVGEMKAVIVLHLCAESMCHQ